MTRAQMSKTMTTKYQDMHVHVMALHNILKFKIGGRKSRGVVWLGDNIDKRVK